MLYTFTAELRQTPSNADLQKPSSSALLSSCLVLRVSLHLYFIRTFKYYINVFSLKHLWSFYAICNLQCSSNKYQNCLTSDIFISGHSKRPKLVLQTDYHLIQVRREHSAILLIFIKLRFVIKIFGLSIFQQQLKTSFTGCTLQSLSNKTQIVFSHVYYTYVYCSHFLTFCLHHQLYSLQCNSNKNQICFH